MFAKKLSLALVATLLFTGAAHAHFPWLVVDEDNHPRVFFGEGLTNQDYHLPETIAKAEVWQTDIDAPNRQVKVETHEEEKFIGLRSEDPIELRGRLQTVVVYGLYHGSKLNYYAQCYPSTDPSAWPSTPAKELPLQALLTPQEDSLLVTLLRDGKPVKGVSVSLSNAEGKEAIKADTDKKGQIEYSLELLSEGRNGLMAMVVDKQDQGELDGKPYKAASHILTVTFTGKPRAKAKTAAAIPPLPEAVTSFGAAAADGWLYVYSGHIGKAHDHSRDNLSQHFRRIKIDGGSEWEELPMQQPLQGLAMVAHGGKVYRIGGLDARNPSGEEADMHSVDSFACFNPANGEWTAMPSLPGCRSSHNATVIGDTLYVVGGWKLSGDDDGEWQSGALAFDLSQPNGPWRELPEPPFRRRALAVGHVDGKLVAISGMDDDLDLSKDVFLFDPASGEWAAGPQFPGKAFHGFGLAAWNEAGVLYAGGMEGVLYHLTGDLSTWESASKFATPRFFHQLVPNGRGGLLAVGGASMEYGHVSQIEELEL